jgi:hypothetical protein
MKQKRIYKIDINQIHTFYVLAFNKTDAYEFYCHRITSFYFAYDMPIQSVIFTPAKGSYKTSTWVEIKEKLLQEWGC